MSSFPGFLTISDILKRNWIWTYDKQTHLSENGKGTISTGLHGLFYAQTEKRNHYAEIRAFETCAFYRKITPHEKFTASLEVTFRFFLIEARKRNLPAIKMNNHMHSREECMTLSLDHPVLRTFLAQ